MIFQIFVVLIVYILYTYLYKPWRLYNYYADNISKLGYRVKKFKWHPIGGRMVQQMKDDFKTYGDALYFSKHAQQYDVVMSVLSGHPLIFLINPDLIKGYFGADKLNIYKKQSRFNGLIKDLLGQGLVFAEGDQWKMKRKIVKQVFTFDFVISMIPLICDQIQQKFESIQQHSSYPKIYLADLMSSIFGTITAKSFFGGDIMKSKIDGIDIQQFANQIINDSFVLSRNPLVFIFGPKLIKLGLTKKHRKYNYQRNTFRQKAKEFIHEKLTKQPTDQQNNRPNFLSAIQKLNKKAQKDQDKYTEEQIVNQFCTLFFAGQATTTQLSVMMIYYMVLYPQVRKKALLQIETFIKTSEDYTYDNLKQLKYLQCIQKQTLRCYGPGVTTFVRQVTQDHKIQDIPIWKGTRISNFGFPNNYNEKYYKDAFKFDPDRWMGDIESNNHPYVNVNFAAGPRSCIGKQLALLQSKIFFAKFLKRYDFQLERNQFRMEVRFGYVPERMYTLLHKK